MVVASLDLLLKKTEKSIGMRTTVVVLLTNVLVLLSTLQHRHCQCPSHESEQTKHYDGLKVRSGVSARLDKLLVLIRSRRGVGTSFISTMLGLLWAISQDAPGSYLNQKVCEAYHVKNTRVRIRVQIKMVSKAIDSLCEE